MTAFGRVALDAEEVRAPSDGDDWRLAWHPPPAAPPGEPHGANAFCVMADGDVVLISSDGARWGWLGGRPEPCADGREKGLVLVRSIWRADVTLLPWRPEHEIPFRRTVPALELARYLWTEPGTEPIYARAAREAGLTLTN